MASYNLRLKLQLECEPVEVNTRIDMLMRLLKSELPKGFSLPEEEKKAPEITVPVVIKPEYSSIHCVADICEPWIELWGGDEWGESMRDLHGACHMDYGFSDEDCALFASKLIENLIFLKEDWIDGDGYDMWGYGYSAENGPIALEETYQRCRDLRDYWSEGGNLKSFEPSKTVANETLDTLPKWLFGE